MKRLTLLAIFFISTASEPLGAQDIIFPEGSFRDSNAEDFSAKNLPSKYYNELWTYHINLENGVQIIYSFSINDFGSFKSRVTGAKLSVSWKDGKTYVANKEYDVEDLIIEPENRFLRLNPDRPYWAKGSFETEHTLNFHNEREGVLYDLNLTLYDISPGKVLGDGTYHIGDNEIGIFLLIPHAKVKGHVAINGNPVKAKGSASMVHIYQNNLSTKLLDKSYRIKQGDTQNGFFINFMNIRSDGGTVPIGYGIRYNNGTTSLLTPSKISSISSTSVRGIQLDNSLMIRPYQMDPLEITVDKHLNTYSIMDELSGVQKFFAKQFIGGEIIEMNGTVRINDNKTGYFYYMVTDD